MRFSLIEQTGDWASFDTFPEVNQIPQGQNSGAERQSIPSLLDPYGVQDPLDGE